MNKTGLTHWVLTLVCEDRPGIVHAISGAIVQAQGNITESHQYTSDDTGRFFMRIQIESPATESEMRERIQKVSDEFEILFSGHRGAWIIADLRGHSVACYRN